MFRDSPQHPQHLSLKEVPRWPWRTCSRRTSILASWRIHSHWDLKKSPGLVVGASKHKWHWSKNFGCEKGHRYPGLKKIRPTNPPYTNAHSNCMHQLEDVLKHCIPYKKHKLHSCHKQMELRFYGRYFLEENPIMEIDFLTSFVHDLSTQEISEPQILMDLLSFHNGFCESR